MAECTTGQGVLVRGEFVMIDRCWGSVNRDAGYIDYHIDGGYMPPYINSMLIYNIKE